MKKDFNLIENPICDILVLILAVLQLVFVPLKLLGVVQWPWWVVFSPVLIGPAIVLLILSCLAGILAISLPFFLTHKLIEWRKEQQ